MSNKQNKHKCHLCMKKVADSKEHLPMKAANNRGKLSLFHIKHGSKKINYNGFATKYEKKGFWLPVLCKKCNNNTGSWYGGAYKDFIFQISQARRINNNQSYIIIHLKNIYPLRIIKQMLSMFLCATPYEPEPIWDNLREFVLDKNKVIPQNAPFVFLYSNTSKNIGRIIPCGGLVNLRTHENMVFSEISWPPLGIVFSFNKNPKVGEMECINHWGKYGFKDRINISIKLPLLLVSTYYPLSFGSVEEVENEMEVNPTIYLFHVPENSNSIINMGIVSKKESKERKNGF